MDFFKWSTIDPLAINKFGIPEPTSKKIIYPDILLVPLVAFDKHLNRVGYGGGFYDRYIQKIRKNKKIKTIGLAYSFQKIKKIPKNILLILENNLSKYDSRGVSFDKKEVHQAIKNIDKGLFPLAFCKIIPDIITGDENYCLVMHADGAGTKSSLASADWQENGDWYYRLE